MKRGVSQTAGGVLSYFTRHKTAANLLLILMIVSGLAAAPNMRAQFFPDVILDTVSVSVKWEGAGADDVDAAIVQVLEPALLSVEGVHSSDSRSTEGSARVSLEFEPGWDMSRAADDVQTAVDAITTLPEDADDPFVRRGVWRDRVTDVVITGPVEVAQLGRFADELLIRLFAEGVTRTTIRGMSAQRTLIEVSSVKLITHDISIAEIATAIAAEVATNPAGDVDSASARVRMGTEKRAPREIASIILRSNPDGTTLTVGDISTIVVEGIDRQRAYFVDEHPAISVRIDRSDKGDAIGIQRAVEEVVAEMQGTLPEGVSMDLIRTRAEAITGRLNLLLDNGLTGLGLVLVLLFLFLNARTAFWVAAGIPVAMCAAIALMYAAGLTINMVSLFGLIITLGIVVDDAIVVGEHADMRARRLGESPIVASENAARRMSKPVFSATVTTVIAFFSLTLVGGRFGDLIADIPFTVIVVLIASLIECFLILPNHMSHALAHSAKDHWYDFPSRVVNIGFRWYRERIFRPVMRLVIWARYPVLASVVLVFSTQAVLFIGGDVQWRFWNAPERGSVTGNFAMLPSATRADTMVQMRAMQEATEALGREYEEKHGINPLDFVLAEVGGNSGRPLYGAEAKDADLLGGIAIELIDADLRPYSSFAFVADLQDRVTQHPMAETVTFRGWRSGPGGDALDVQFFGADSDTLKAASEALKDSLARFPEVSAVEDNLAYDKEEVILELTPQGQALGFSVEGLGRVLRHRLNGLEAATYPDGPRSASIRVQLPDGELTANFLEGSLMRTPAGEYVPLADIVSVERRTGFSTVRRENGIRVISVTGDISEDDPARAEEIMDALRGDILPTIAAEKQIEWKMAGLSEQEDSFLADAQFGFLMCLTGIYLVLSWVFSSWTRPIVVMAIIPFGLVGTIFGHYLHGVPMSMFTVIGLLGMTGIIINDSIVLVTTIDEYAEDRGLVPSIIDGAADRLRPVMLTTMTTVLGLTPLLFERSQQAQFLKPTVITLVYGLGFGMVLVLVVVPALIAVQADVGRQATAFRHGLRARGVREPLVLAGSLAAVWGVVTIGWLLVKGEIHPVVTAQFPALASINSPAFAAALFVLGTALVVLITFLISALGYAFARRRAQAVRATQAGA